MLDRFFKLQEHHTTPRQEVIAGITTFATMAYIIVVNPKVLEAAGMPFGATMVATILSAFIGTFLMGVYANRPFAVAPYMGQNAFIAYTVVEVLGYSWQTALGAIFVSGCLFIIITLLKVRSWLARSLPKALKAGFAAGIGMFLIFIGISNVGIVEAGAGSAPVHVGDLTSLPVILAAISFLFIGYLMIKKVNGAMLIGILAITIVGFVTGATEIPSEWVSTPPSLGPIFMELDVAGALAWGFFSVILTIFIIDFVDTMDTLIGVAYDTDMLDEDGNLPEIEKPLLCDAIATSAGALLGTSTTGTFIESAAGIKAGGRTGLTAVVTSMLFLMALFLSPFFSIIPAYAYSPVLIMVGVMMISPLKDVDYGDMTESIPAILTVTLMSFTYNIGIGLTAGLASYPILKLITGRSNEVSTGLWVLGVLSLLFYIFYPYA